MTLEQFLAECEREAILQFGDLGPKNSAFRKLLAIIRVQAEALAEYEDQPILYADTMKEEFVARDAQAQVRKVVEG